MTTHDTNIPSAHSEFGPSGSSRWMSCPASIKMIRDLNLPRTSNKYADYGSCAHELGAMMLIDPTVTAESQLGKVLYANVKVDKEMVKGVDEYVEHVMSYQTQTSKLSVENRVSLEHLQPGTFGTTDAVITDIPNGIVHVIDLKFGRGLVEVEHNSQLELYAIGTILDLAKRGINLDDIKKVVLHIVQPRGLHDDGPIRLWETSIEALKEVSRRAREAIVNACSDDPDFNPGEKQCRWCEASGICRPLAEYNLKLATGEFQEFSTLNEATFIDANKLSKDEISVLLENIQVIQDWTSSVLAHATDSLRRGELVPNYKLVRGRSIRKWDTFSDGVLEKLLLGDDLDLHLDRKDIYKEKIASPTQIEALISKDEYEKKIKPMVVKPLGKITMAHSSDKRKAIEPDMDASEEFSSFV